MLPCICSLHPIASIHLNRGSTQSDSAVWRCKPKESATCSTAVSFNLRSYRVSGELFQEVMMASANTFQRHAAEAVLRATSVGQG